MYIIFLEYDILQGGQHMQKSILNLEYAGNQSYQTVFKNNHGRKIYIRIKVSDSELVICSCLYVDRPMRNGFRSIPLKLKTMHCNNTNDLLKIMQSELDKKFYAITFSNEADVLSPEEYVNSKLSVKEKYKFLILISEDDKLKTRIKNRIHRSIYLEIKCGNEYSIIQKCYYYDKAYKKNIFITPAGLNTIFFEYTPQKILEIVNNELNCDFTDLIITNDTFGFDDNNIPICGSI